MRRIVAQRLLWSAPMVLLVSALTFVLAWLTPGDAARTVLGTNTNPEAYQQVRTQLGLDQSLATQYTSWLSGVVRGDFGESLFTGESVSTILAQRAGVSLSLILGATLVCAVVGVGLGTLSAVVGGWVARAVDALSLFGMSVPTFWFALLLVLVAAVRFPLFPATGYVPLTQSPAAWFVCLVLPVIALAVGGIAMVAKQTRGAMIDVLGKEYIRVLRANGVRPRAILLRHGLKNAAVPVVTVLGLIMVGLLGGTILVEQVFALPGIGSLAVTATAKHDLPVLEGVVVAYALIVVVLNLATDLAYAWLNPRIEAA